MAAALSNLAIDPKKAEAISPGTGFGGVDERMSLVLHR
jgi:hypothetical protein